MHVNVTPISRNLRFFITSFFLLACSLGGFAQARFNTVVNERHPGLADYVQVEYTIENAKSVEKIEPPTFKNFRIVQGPIQSNGMSIMNGVLSQYKSLTYILQPTTTGTLSIPGTSAIIDGKAVQSQTVSIEVTKKGNGNSANANPGITPPMPLFPEAEPQVEEEYTLRPGESLPEKIKKNLYVKAEVNKTTCYEGEPIVATFTLSSRLRSESKVLKRPSLNGFSVIDMIEPEDNRPTVQTINGRPFNVHIIRKTQLFPLQAGNFEIDPVELENNVRFLKPSADNSGKSPMQDFMDEFMSGRRRGELVEQTFNLGSKPIAITVKPLPAANKPVGFNGAVGRFAMKVEGKQQTVAAGEPITLRVQIKGQGNFNMLNALPLQMPENMDVYEPVQKEELDKSIYPLSGTKTFTYTLIPKDTGNLVIPAIAFSYFDPTDARYKTETSDSFQISVTPSLKKKSLIGKIFPKADSDSNATQALPVMTVALVAALLFLVTLGIIRWRRSKKKPAPAPQVMSTPPAAPQEAPLHAYSLEKARAAMYDGKSQLFYSEINNTIWTALTKRLGIPASALNKYNAVTKLQLQGAPPELTKQLESVLHDCELALYTPVHSTIDMNATLDRAQALLKGLEQPFV